MFSGITFFKKHMAMEIKSLNFTELVAAEKAANVVRKNYEDKAVTYNTGNYGALSKEQQKEYLELSKNLSAINAVRIKILAEMENKLLDIE